MPTLLVNTMLILLVVVCMLALSRASRAPDVAPDLPDGWCKGGKPTSTTAECICSPGVCVGRGCHREQGFEWYKPDCSTCRCTRKGAAGAPGQETQAAGADDQSTQQQQQRSQTARGRPAAMHQPAQLVEERAEPATLSSSPLLLWAEMMEDHPLVFLLLGSAAAVLVVLLAMRGMRAEVCSLLCVYACTRVFVRVFMRVCASCS